MFRLMKLRHGFLNCFIYNNQNQEYFFLGLNQPQINHDLLICFSSSGYSPPRRPT